MSIQTSLISGVRLLFLGLRASLVVESLLYEVDASKILLLLCSLLCASSASDLLITSVALKVSAAAISPSP